MDAVAEIKARIAIEDLVGQYVQLKKAGRNLKGLCPFHKERTPSFMVSPERQLAYCFGCHKGGDHFKFIEEIEGLDFRGALAFLAEKAGVTLSRTPIEERYKKTERDKLVELHEAATQYFEKQLFETGEGKKALSYLKKRDLKEETVKSMRLGFSGESLNGLFTYLIGKDFKRDEILSSGLCIARDTEAGMREGVVDRFRSRLMFPIQNLGGQICAFGGRAFKEGDEPKYLNSPETPVYHKSSILYGLSLARPEIRNKSFVIVVEGYMDAIAVYQAGYKNVVAVSGTALTESQLALLKRFTKSLIFALDRDTAGKLATERALELGFDNEFSMKVAVWEGDAKDPDECLKKNHKLFAKAIEAPIPADDYLLNYYKESADISKVDGKKKIMSGLLPFWGRVKSPLELDEWLKKCAFELGSSTESLYDELKRYLGKQRIMPKSNIAENTAFSDRKDLQSQEYLIGLLLTYPETNRIVIPLLKVEDFDDKELQNIYRSLTTQYNQTLDSEKQTASQSGKSDWLGLSEDEKKRADLLSMYIENKSADMPFNAVEREVSETLKGVIKHRFDREKRSLLIKLKQSGKDEKNSLLESYQELLTEEEKLISTL